MSTSRRVRSHIDIVSVACIRFHMVDDAIARSHEMQYSFAPATCVYKREQESLATMQRISRCLRLLDCCINADNKRRLLTERCTWFRKDLPMHERGTASTTVTAIDVFLELAMVLLAAHLFLTLQMRVRTKLTVIMNVLKHNLISVSEPY